MATVSEMETVQQEGGETENRKGKEDGKRFDSAIQE